MLSKYLDVIGGMYTINVTKIDKLLDLISQQDNSGKTGMEVLTNSPSLPYCKTGGGFSRTGTD